MIKKWHLLLIILLSLHTISWSYSPQSDELDQPHAIQNINIHQQDSINRARHAFVQDSLKHVKDSIARVWIKLPSSKRTNIFLDSLANVYEVKNLNFEAWGKQFPPKKAQSLEGQYRLKREQWIIGLIFLTIILFGIIKNAFAKHLTEIVFLFYSNRSFFRVKEDSLFNAWVFLFLYLLFGITFGLYSYLATDYLHISHPETGFRWFLMLSAAALGLFAAKIIALQLLGFIFGLQKLIKEHVAALFILLSNITFLFIPIVVILSLLPSSLAKTGVQVSLFLLACVFIFQGLRAFFRILFGHQFSIIYLFIYLCVLELCPLIILIKIFRF